MTRLSPIPVKRSGWTSPRRPSTLVRVALGVTAALAVGVAGGCAQTNAPPPPPVGGLPTTLALARFPAAPAKRLGGARSERAARSAPTPLLAALAPVADTPLEQLLRAGDRPLANNGLCPPDMASIDDRFCVDRFEAGLVEILPNGEERPWSAYHSVEGHVVRAVSAEGSVPQAYVSGTQAAEACARSGKRLCKPAEWKKACKGPEKKTYGYGDASEAKRCNDQGRGPMGVLFAGQFNADDRREWNWERMNNPELNQLPGTVATAGAFEACTNGYGVHDMVGNLHEWVDDPAGTFQGGYYQDTHLNGDGCDYVTKAHAVWYHDYSTGFRCCADPAP